jgi:hypothetical protein
MNYDTEISSTSDTVVNLQSSCYLNSGIDSFTTIIRSPESHSWKQNSQRGGEIGITNKDFITTPLPNSS